MEEKQSKTPEIRHGARSAIRMHREAKGDLLSTMLIAFFRVAALSNCSKKIAKRKKNGNVIVAVVVIVDEEQGGGGGGRKGRSATRRKLWYTAS